MTEVISVRFRNGCKNYDFAPRGLQVKMGDQVIVETAQGPEFAICSQGNHEVPDEAIVKTLSPVLRMATENDRRIVEHNRKRESEAFDVCERKIASHGLEMKLVSVSISFDGSKLVFYFTADGRVDFRDLVRDLASVFRARIELRQIGVRDEAKMIGGLGICGRPFCCSQFLDGFLPVSIKMAKTQNLSLNPTKISGTCGRLMCCLKYEQNAYEDAAKRMPKAESFVQTPDGPGNVKSVDLLQETVKVSLDASPEPLKRYRSCEIRVLRNGKGSREGIEIPERPARYVEEREEEPFGTPILSTPFYMHPDLEDAPVREKMGEGGEGSKRRHRGGRRRSGGKSGGNAGAAGSANAGTPAPSRSAQQSKAPGRPARPPKPPKVDQRPERAERAEAQEGGEAAKRRRPRHRGGRRRGGGNRGGEGGSAPKAE